MAPTCYGGPRWDCTPTAEAAPPRSFLMLRRALGGRRGAIVNILFCGDVMGRAGREAVRTHVPALRRDLALDLVVVNAENAAHGFGLTERLCGELYDCGVDILTTGNHVWDQRELIAYIDRDPRVLRPANFPPGTPGAGWRLHPVAGGRNVLVVNLMGRLFMDALDDPFARLDAILADHPLGAGAARDPRRLPCRGVERKDGARPFRRRPRLGCVRHAFPCARPPTRRSCRAAPPIRPTPGCAATMIR